MKSVKKNISFIILSVYLCTMLFQSVAYGTQLENIQEDPLTGLSLSFSTNEINTDESIDMELLLPNMEESPYEVVATFVNDGDESISSMVHFSENGIGNYSAIINGNQFQNSGTYQLTELIINTNQERYNILDLSTSGEGPKLDFSPYYFDYVNIYENISDHLSINKAEFTATDLLQISIDRSSLDFQFSSVIADFRNENGTEFRLEGFMDYDNNFVFEKAVNAYQEAGSYKLRSLSLSGEMDWLSIENSSGYENSTYVQSSDFSNLDFIVTGTSIDHEKPVFHDLVMSSNSISIGETMTIRLEAEDAISGLGYASAVFSNEEGETIRMELSPEKQWTETVGPYLKQTPGLYQLKQISVSDKAQNVVNMFNKEYAAEYHNEGDFFDFSKYTLEITGTLGNNLPNASLDLNQVKYTGKDTVKVTAAIDEAFSSTKYITANFRDNDLYKNIEMKLEKNTDGTYSGEYYISNYHENGEFELQNLELMIDGFEPIRISDSNNPSYGHYEEDLSGNTIHIEGTKAEEGSSFKIVSDKETYNLYEEVRLYLDIEDPEYRLSDFSGTIVHEDNYSDDSNGEESHYMLFEYNSMAKRYEGSLMVQNSMKPGSYKIRDISMLSEESNNYLSPLYEETLFNVEGTVGKINPQLIVSVDKKTAEPGDTVQIQVASAEDMEYFDRGEIQIISKNNDQYREYYSLTKNAEGIFTADIPVKEYMETGEFLIEYLVLKGFEHYYELMPFMEGGSVLSGGTFTILNTKPDRFPPEIRGIKVEKPEIRFGEDINIELDLVEEGSGIKYGNVELQLKDSYHSINLPIQYEAGKYIAKTNMKGYITPGVYMLGSISATDNAGNSVWIDQDSENQVLDFENPIIEIVSEEIKSFDIEIDKSELGPKSEYIISGKILIPGVLIRQIYIGISDSDNINYLHATADVNLDGSFMYKGVVAPNTLQGDYQVTRLDVITDKGSYNLDSSSGEMYDFSKTGFTVKDTVEDYEGPLFENVSVDKSEAKPGEVVTITVTASDKLSGLSHGNVYYIDHENGKSKSISLTGSSENTLQGKFKVESYDPSSTWNIDAIELYDYSENSSSYVNSKYSSLNTPNRKDFSKGTINTIGTKEDSTPPLFVSANMKDNKITAVTPLDILIEASDSDTGVEKVIVVFDHQGPYNEQFEAKPVGGNQYRVLRYYDIMSEYLMFFNRIEIYDKAGNKTVVSTFPQKMDAENDRNIVKDLRDFDLEFNLISKEQQTEKMEEFILTANDVDDKESLVNMKETLLEMKNSIDDLPDTTENNTKKEEYYEVLQNVMKAEKVIDRVAPENQHSMETDAKNLNALNIPEALDENVTGIQVELKTELLSKEEAAKFSEKVTTDKTILALYDMSLMKVIQKKDSSQSSAKISNEDIKEKITLRMAVPEEYLEEEHLLVVYISESGEMKEYYAEDVIENGIRYLYFMTDHFSVYGIASSTDPILPPVDEKPIVETPDDVVEEPTVETPDDVEEPTVEAPDDVVESEEPTPEKPAVEGPGEEAETNTDKPVESEIENKDPQEDLSQSEETIKENSEEDIKSDESLPKAGEINEPFYSGIGVLLIFIGLIITSRKKKTV